MPTEKVWGNPDCSGDKFSTILRVRLLPTKIAIARGVRGRNSCVWEQLGTNTQAITEWGLSFECH
ncbi:hypothetical protein NG792_18275 [Laspinema sp. C3]|uniref:Uncharacterized protein n=1 Tax=Laspinema olomoucense D3b TaxID=2953688 RepID=A0ABT2NAS5_9CYAN|nr:hypothetical protein [Laspinema sp. D3b]